MTFVHHSEFRSHSTHKHDLRMKRDDPDNALALTDDIEIAPTATDIDALKVEVSELDKLSEEIAAFRESCIG